MHYFQLQKLEFEQRQSLATKLVVALGYKLTVRTQFVTIPN